MILSTAVYVVIYTRFPLQLFSEGIVETLKMYRARHFKTRRHGFISLTGIKIDVADWTAGVSFFGKLNPIFTLSIRKSDLCVLSYGCCGNVI